VVRCYLGLGSNLGDRARAIRESVDLIAAGGDVEVKALSSLYATKPWGKEDQPDFVNAVAEVETSLRPEELLARAKRVEGEMGRRSRQRWGPREIDIDLLLYGDEVVETGDLRVPHPGIEERAFVLVPLLELAPDLLHPGSGKRLAESLEQLTSRGEVTWQKLTT
jgi:2-amino-4-hydroxy-6-hydroxymethyldihydropteridine diphosphokinase